MIAHTAAWGDQAEELGAPWDENLATDGGSRPSLTGGVELKSDEALYEWRDTDQSSLFYAPTLRAATHSFVVVVSWYNNPVRDEIVSLSSM